MPRKEQLPAIWMPYQDRDRSAMTLCYSDLEQSLWTMVEVLEGRCQSERLVLMWQDHFPALSALALRYAAQMEIRGCLPKKYQERRKDWFKHRLVPLPQFVDEALTASHRANLMRIAYKNKDEIMAKEGQSKLTYYLGLFQEEADLSLQKLQKIQLFWPPHARPTGQINP